MGNPTHAGGMYPYLMNYISGSTAACGTTSTAVTVPSGAKCFDIHAEGAAVYYSINAAAAVSTSPGYLASDTHWFFGPVNNLGTLYVIGGGTAAVAHVDFFNY